MKPVLKRRLQSGEAVFGALQNIFAPPVTEAIARAGVDFILFDLEHAGYATSELDSCILTAYGYDVPALVRPREINHSLIEQALEAGAQGVVLPTVETREQCELIVQACKYGPWGARGFDPTYPVSRWMDHYNVDTYLADANRDTLVIILVETPMGFANLPEMLEVDGIDGVMLGAADLTVRMGKPIGGTMGGLTGDEEVTEILRRARKQTIDAGKICLAVARRDTVRDSYDEGARMFISPTMDGFVLFDYYSEAVRYGRSSIS
ncbi:HpcH/HpaI aldolase family protein [Rhodococcus sp. 5G237]